MATKVQQSAFELLLKVTDMAKEYVNQYRSVTDKSDGKALIDLKNNLSSLSQTRTPLVDFIYSNPLDTPENQQKLQAIVNNFLGNEYRRKERALFFMSDDQGLKEALKFSYATVNPQF